MEETAMTVLRVDASIQGDRSTGSALADLVMTPVAARLPDEPVVRRHLGQQPLPSDAWAQAVGALWLPEDRHTAAQAEALSLARTVAGELSAADGAVLALPLYNWGVSQHVKTWIDLAIAGAPHGTRLLDGKPVVLLFTRGGAYGPGTPKEGWDHALAYLRRVLVDVWGANLTVVERELTLVGVNPALDGLADLAAVAKADAEAAATAAGRALAERLAGTTRAAA
jgi:FMN-dependent NADH-azoreductase